MSRAPATLPTLVLFAGILVSGCGSGGEEPEVPSSLEPSEDQLTSLVDHELAFAEMAQTGVADAFRTFIAEGGILFRPGPVDGQELLRGDPPFPASLRWVPTAAALASSGDLGYTTGPFIATDPEGREGHGQYLSIWQAFPTRGFRVVLDIGTVNPSQGPLPESAEVVAELDSMTVLPRTDPSDGDPGPLESLKAVDRGYAVVQATEGTISALVRYGSSSVRVHRNGIIPIVGFSEAEGSESLAEERYSTSPIDGRVSASGTLGYLYGSVAGGGRPDAGSYVRIWRRDPGGSWTLAVELISAPPA